MMLGDHQPAQTRHRDTAGDTTGMWPQGSWHLCGERKVSPEDQEVSLCLVWPSH
jgi:hypothetical protein